MKKIFTLLFVALCAMSASAITVTYDGKTIENGSTVTVGADVFKRIEKIPGIKYTMDAQVDFYVTGATNLTLSATSTTNFLGICAMGGDCLNFSDPVDGVYSLNIRNFTKGFDIRCSYSKTEVPKEIHTADVMLHSNEGDFKFKFVLDTTGNAGISGVENDFNGVYTVYSIVGVKVLETTEKSDINNLPAGIYIVNGEKVIIR